MIRWLVLFLAALTGMNAAADDLVRACAACHGADGHSRAAGTPHLAGQRAAYLIDQMLNFQLLSRRDPTDSAHAKFPASIDQKKGQGNKSPSGRQTKRARLKTRAPIVC